MSYDKYHVAVQRAKALNESGSTEATQLLVNNLHIMRLFIDKVHSADLDRLLSYMAKGSPESIQVAAELSSRMKAALVF